MKTIQAWFAEYNESHQNTLNKHIHWLCVPAILFSIIGLLMCVHIAVVAIAMVLSWLFYFKLDRGLCLALVILMTVMASIAYVLPYLWLYVAIFVVAWIGQFYGHHIEGKKPSFFKDLQFLLIGPAWCMDAWLANFAFYQSKNPN